MPLGVLLGFGIDIALDRSLSAVGYLAKGRAQALLAKVHDHFTLSSTDLADAVQASFRQGVSAIALGVAPRNAMDAVLAMPGQLLSSKLAKEFAAAIEARYVQPFIDSRALDAARSDRLRADTVRHGRALARRAADILPVADLPAPAEAADLLRDTRRDDIARLVIDRIGGQAVVLPSDLIDLYCHDGLLGDAVLFFLREALRRNGRVQATLSALRQEGLLAEVERVLRQQDQAQSSIDRFAEQFGQFHALFSDRDAAVLDALDNVGNRLEQALRAAVDEIKETFRAELQRCAAEVEPALVAAGRGTEVKVAHAVAPWSGGPAALIDRGRDLIRDVHKAAAASPSAANAIAAALVNTGDEPRIAEAERLFERALDQAQDVAERARAAHNLYQVRLLRRDFAAALGPFKQAVALNPRRYAPFDLSKFHPERILGAGGMGCVFLCHEPLRRRRVAVKSLWQRRSDSTEALFAEFSAMEAVDSEVVPAALDYGAGPGTEDPYVVMPYLAGFLDGEAWLGRHGPLAPADAMAVGRQVAAALTMAHGRTPAVPHLDIKPANLMLARRDGAITVKLIDWGLARFGVSLGDASRAGTQAGTTHFGRMIMGTWDYMPEEQKHGHPVPKSDIYALGKTLYRLSTNASAHSLSGRRLRDLGAFGAMIQDCTETQAEERPTAAEVLSRLGTGDGPAVQRGDAAPGPAPDGGPSKGSGRPWLSWVMGARQPDGDSGPQPQAPQPAPPRRRSTPPAKPPVEVLPESAAAWPEGKCVFRDWGKDGRSDPTLPQMVVIPAGRFTMGSPETEPERHESEGPQRPVTIARPFALGRYAVTQAEWQALMGNNPSRFKGDRNPVERVSWEDAQAFIKKLNAKLGLSAADAYRLPSEAEWEYACRVGTTTPFWWGRTITSKQANYDGNYTYNNGAKGEYRQSTVSVDQFDPNPFGLYQTHGNVYEWCEDCYHGGYSSMPKVVKEEGCAWTEENCRHRVLRGGSWFNYPGYVRSAYRGRLTAGYRSYHIGFRLARTLNP